MGGEAACWYSSRGCIISEASVMLEAGEKGMRSRNHARVSKNNWDAFC